MNDVLSEMEQYLELEAVAGGFCGIGCIGRTY